jgi:hypothetical protein
VGDEPLRRELGAVAVAAGQAGAPDVQLAGHPDGHRLASRIEDVQLGVGDGSPDAQRLATGRDPQGSGPDRGLRRPVQVPQLIAAVQELIGQRHRQRFPAAQHPQAAAAAPSRLDQHAPRGRGRLHHRGTRLVQQRHQPARVRGCFGRGDRDLGARHQRQPQLEAGDVERERRHRHQHVARPEPRTLGHGREEVDQGPGGDLHPLGPPGRPRRVDHVGEVVGARG